MFAEKIKENKYYKAFHRLKLYYNNYHMAFVHELIVIIMHFILQLSRKY